MYRQVDELRSNVRYVPTRRHAIQSVFRRVTDVSGSITSDPSLAQQIRTRLASRELRKLLAQGYECVRLLVGSELDTSIGGERGLGRTTTTVPRLGGRFRSNLPPAVATQLGPLMEELCIAGFAAGAAVDVLGRADPTAFVERDIEPLILHWVTRGIGTWREWPDEVRAVVVACCRGEIDDFVAVAESCGLLDGFRKRRKGRLVEETALMLVAAGVGLLAAHAPINDHWFS